MFILYVRQSWSFEYGVTWNKTRHATMADVYHYIACYTRFNAEFDVLIEKQGIYTVNGCYSACGSFYVTSEFDDVKRVINPHKIQVKRRPRDYAPATRRSRKPRYKAQWVKCDRHGGKRALWHEKEDDEPAVRYGAQYPYQSFYDDPYYRQPQRSWKKFRKTQYKPLS